MRIEWSPRARKDARKLSEQDRRRVIEWLDRYAETSHGDVKRLTDVDAPEHRLRVGSFRVRFQLQDDVLLVLRVLDRKDAY